MKTNEIEDKIIEHEIKFNLLVNSFNIDTFSVNENIRQLQKINYELQYLKTLKDRSLWKTKKKK